MTPRLLVVCLGGLAGAGAIVCCDMDEETETLDVQAEGEAVDASPNGAELVETDPAPVH